MNVQGTRKEYNVNIEITEKECLENMSKALGFRLNYFIKDDAIYEWQDIGYHKTDIEESLVTEDIEKVEQLKALETLKKAFKVRF